MLALDRYLKYSIFFILTLGVGLLSSLFVEQFANVKIDTSIGGGSFQYFIGLAWAIFIWIIILLIPIPAQEKKVLSWLWIFRSFVTLGFMIFYESVYSLDASLYYRDAVFNSFYFSWSDFYGTSTVTALAALINNTLPVFSSYHAIKVIFSAFGLWGAWFYYKAFSLHFENGIRFFWFIGLFPSALFWSSILGKDPLTFLGLGIFAYGISMLYKNSSLRSIFIMVVGAVLITFVRFWLPIIFSIAIALTYIFKKSNGSNGTFKKWMALSGFIGFIFFALDFFSKRINYLNLFDAYERVNMMSRSWNSGGSSLAVPTFNSIFDVLLFIPQGAFAALFRPLPGEINNPFGIISGVENFILLFLFLRFLYNKLKYVFKSSYQTYLFFTIIIWSIIYGFFSYQNLGTAVRFKLQILPYLLTLIFLTFDKKEKNEIK